MTDQEWLALLEKSPDKARLSLIEDYSDLVYVIVLSKLRGTADHEDIKDCISDVFVEIFRSMGKFDPQKGSLKNFVTAIAKNTSLNAFRHLSLSRSRTVSADDESTELPPSDLDIEEELIGRISAERLWDMVRSLGRPDSAILVYQYFYQFKVHEIAAKLSMTPDAVQKRSLRARRRIREMIDEERRDHDE